MVVWRNINFSIRAHVANFTKFIHKNFKDINNIRIAIAPVKPQVIDPAVDPHPAVTLTLTGINIRN